MGEKAAITKILKNKEKASVLSKPKENLSHILNSSVEQILHLQRTIGNQAVQRLIKSGSIQTKLKINKPNNKYEQEADRAADKVMRMPKPKRSFVNGHSSLVQWQAVEEKEAGRTKRLQRQESEEEETAQSKGASLQPQTASSTVESGIQSLKGGGQPLPESTRSFFEARFGSDFSRVRVHTNSQAVGTAKSINAKAFTTGKDIIFGAGQYAPGTHEGKKLLAHELVHTIQQSRRSGTIQRFDFCDTTDQCSARETGEKERSISSPMVVEKLSGSIEGLLVGNFAIGSATIKKDLNANVEWKSFQTGIAAHPGNDWEILGFSDCTGGVSINEPLREKRAQAVYNALANDARGKVTNFKKAPLRECMASDKTEAGRSKNRSAIIWKVNAPTPAAPPALTTVKGPFDHSVCGTVKPGMPVDERDKIVACISHSKYVNVMNQSIANMKQVSTPYALGLGDLYDGMLKEVVKDGQNNFPRPGSPKNYTQKNLNVRVSSATTLPVSTFTLTLEQEGTQRPNGSSSGGGITLNETSDAGIKATILGKKVEVERVMYHEGFHYLSGVVSMANRSVRRQVPPGVIVRPELDYELVKTYQDKFENTVTPFWEEALRTKSNVEPALVPQKAKAQAGLHWIKSSNEILSRVEEAVYLAARDGRGFTHADLTALKQEWVFAADYWNPFLITTKDLQDYINAKQTEIEKKLMPVVLDVQKAYFRARPST
jgi:hypothetical protein